MRLTDAKVKDNDIVRESVNENKPQWRTNPVSGILGIFGAIGSITGLCVFLFYNWQYGVAPLFGGLILVGLAEIIRLLDVDRRR